MHHRLGSGQDPGERRQHQELGHCGRAVPPTGQAPLLHARRGRHQSRPKGVCARARVCLRLCHVKNGRRTERTREEIT